MIANYYEEKIMTKILNLTLLSFLSIMFTLSVHAKVVAIENKGLIGNAPFEFEVNISVYNNADYFTKSIDWGDGNLISEFDEVHTYKLPGEYFVKIVNIIVFDNPKYNYEEVTIFKVIVTEFLEVEISSESNLKCNPGICLDMKSLLNITLNPEYYSYKWMINGNLSTYSEPEPKICFDEPGTYEVALMVKGFLEETEVTSNSIIVEVWDEFVVDFITDAEDDTKYITPNIDDPNNSFFEVTFNFTDITLGNNIVKTNAWFIDGEDITNNANGTLTASLYLKYPINIDESEFPKTYSISLESSNDCPSEGFKEKVITIRKPIIKNIETNTDFEILNYNNKYEFKIKNQIIESIEIFDIMGNSIKVVNNQKIINLSNVSKGLYFVNIITNSHNFTKKLIVD